MKKCKNKQCLSYKTGIEVSYAGNRNAKIIFVGESPWTEENAAALRGEGEPFIGQSGQLAREDIKEIGLNWYDFFIINSARCSIDKNKLTTKQITNILKCCRPKVLAAINTIKPKAIVCFGDVAFRQILKRSGITKARQEGWIWSSEFSCWVLPVFHPSHILRKKFLRPRFQDDLKKIKDFIDNNYNPPQDTEKLDYIDIDDSINSTLRFKKDMQMWYNNGTTIGIDTETQGVDIYNPNFVFISYSVSAENGKGYQIRLWEEVKDNDPGIKDNLFPVIKWPRLIDGKKKKQLASVYVRKCKNYTEKLKALKLLLAAKNIKKYMMTLFDFHVFNKYNLKVNSFVLDIQSGAHVLDENLYKMSSLSELQTSFTDVKTNYKYNFSKQFDKADMLLADKKDRKAFNLYAIRDADITRRIGINIKKELLKNPRLLRYYSKFVIETEKRTLFNLEKNGVYFDAIKLPKAKKDVKKLIDRYEKNSLKLISPKVKEDHNEKGLKLTRRDLISDVLYTQNGFGLNVIKRTKTGPSIDKMTRIQLSSQNISKEAKSFIRNYDKWLECHTLYTRYLNNLENHVKLDKKLHPGVSITTAVTGRLAYSQPNLQNQPKRSELAWIIRQLLRASPGYILLATDGAQAELRIIAHVANDKEMIRVFNADEDIHTNTAKSLSKKSWNELSDKDKKKFRTSAKSVNFGLIYGMSLKGFRQYVKKDYEIDLSWSDGQEWMDTFFSLYKDIKPYHRNTIDFCRRYGYVESIFGRRRRLPDIYSDNEYVRASAERMAINDLIQGPSSDTILMVANEIDKLGLNQKEIRPILFVHDELVYEVKDNSKVMDYAKIIKHHMENPPLKRDFGTELKVPLKADVKLGYNLAEMKEIEI